MHDTEGTSKIGIWQTRGSDFSSPVGGPIFEDKYSPPTGGEKAEMPGQPKPIFEAPSVYVHTPYQPHATIAAIATPPGEGGVAIVRISGSEALSVAEKICSGKVRSYKTHTAHLSHILNAQQEVIDEALVLVMLGSRSYTGEDTVEIHCHGGALVTRRVLEAALLAGAQAAKPGEFTFKAFMNGKIDLSQAEAVQQLIGAKNSLAMHAAKEQLAGRLSNEVRQLQKELFDSAAVLEAWVDFPEEGLEFMTLESILETLQRTREKMRKLHETFHEGKRISQGISLCLIGLPNAGKSSLMNALLGKERCIVTHIAGTTRDLLEEELLLGSLHFRLIDTAGIRPTEELIEQEGIRRSKEAMQEADLILLILDATQPVCEEAQKLIESAPADKRLLVWNKCDLLQERGSEDKLFISAKERWGLDRLKEEIERLMWREGPPSKEQIVLTSARHHLALGQALDSLGALIDALQSGASAEFAAADMRATLVALGTILGTHITEEILSALFSKFCVGK